MRRLNERSNNSNAILLENRVLSSTYTDFQIEFTRSEKSLISYPGDRKFSTTESLILAQDERWRRA